MKYNLLLITFLCLTFLCCRKKKEVECPPLATITVPQFYRQFNFKPSSFWIFKNTSTNVIDTLRVSASEGFKIKDEIHTTKGGGCAADYHEEYRISFSHKKMFPFGLNSLFYYVDYDGHNYFKDGDNHTGAFILKNIGDSIGTINTSKAKTENIYPTFLII